MVSGENSFFFLSFIRCVTMIVTSIKCDMTSNTLHDFPCTLSKHTRRCLSRTKRIIIGISDSYTGFRVQIFPRSISACLAVRQQLLKPQTSIKYIREKAIQLASDKWISYLLLYTHANVFKHESKLYFNIHFEPNIAFTRLDLIHTGSSYRCICCYLYVENSILICTLWLLTKKKLYFRIEFMHDFFNRIHLSISFPWEIKSPIETGCRSFSTCRNLWTNSNF